MSYTPINWQTGDTITAEKMNKMDNGWSVSRNDTTYINNESVTTNDTGSGTCIGPTSCQDAITDDSIIVVFNGTTYTCARGGFGYGAVENGPVADFTSYPFGLVPLGPVMLVTETAGTYTLTVSASSTSIEVSDSFQTAVSNCVDTSTLPMECVSSETTIQEMREAADTGRLLFFHPYESAKSTVCIITSFASEFVSFIPERTGISATFENDVFTVVISM